MSPLRVRGYNTFHRDIEVAIPEVISCDGKVSKHSRRTESAKSEGQRPLDTLNAYSSAWGMCLDQVFIPQKKSEPTAMPDLLRGLDISGGAVITSDALNTKTPTTDAIIAGGGNYVLAVKLNHPTLYEDFQSYFDEEQLDKIRQGKDDACQYYAYAEKEHGAEVTREYFLSTHANWFYKSEQWSGLKAVGMEYKTVKPDNVNEQVKTVCRYYICSIKDISVFAHAVRSHWGVENGLHSQLDFTFKDDANKTMEGNGAEGLQIFKKIALAILKVSHIEA
jgi:predicted transposase YbfD/YdcC